jgi:uncharacterized membrane protein
LIVGVLAVLLELMTILICAFENGADVVMSTSTPEYTPATSLYWITGMVAFFQYVVLIEDEDVAVL